MKHVRAGHHDVGAGLAHLAKVTARDIQRVARHLFVAPKMHLAVVGPLAETEASRLSGMCHL